MKKHAFYFIIIVLLVLLFFHKVFEGKILLPADISLRLQPWRSYSPLLFPHFQRVYNPLLDVILYFYPWRVLLERSLREGFIPLWNSYNFCGQPFLANMASACLYPINWLLLFIPAHWLMTLSVIFHFILTSLFAYLFFTSLGIERKPALLGAIIWTFSGPMVVWAEYQTPVASMTWFPLSLLLWQVFLQKGQKSFALLTGFPLALSLLGGHTQFALYGWLAFLLFALFQILTEREFRRGITGLLLALATGFILSLPQLLPALELAERSHRSLGSSLHEILDTALPWRHLYTFLIPDFYGNPVDYDYRGAFNYVELCGYFGLLPFFLLPSALKRKEGRFFLSLALFSLLFALNTPFLRLLPSLPIFSFLAAPARNLYITAFCFSAIASLGLDNLKSMSPRIPLSTFSALLLLAGMGISQQAVKTGIPTPRALLHFFLIACSALLFTRWKKEIPLLLLAIVDMFAFGLRFNPALPPSMLFPPTPLSKKVALLPRDGHSLALPGEKDPLDTLLPNCNILLGLREAQGGDSLYPLRFLFFAQLANQSKERSNALYFRNPYSPLLDIAGVRYMLSKKPLNASKFLSLYEGELFLFENKNSFPRFYLASETLNAINGEKALQLLPSIEDTTKVIVEGGKALHKGIPRYSITPEEERLGFMKLKIQTDREAYFVVTETFFPGWKAFVDGKEEKVVPADFVFQGVLIPPGEHKLLLAYRPFSFKFGFYFSLLGLSESLAFLYVEGKRRILSKAKRR